MTPYRILPTIVCVFLAAHQVGAQQEESGRDSVGFVESSVTYYDILRHTSNVQSFSLSAEDYLFRGRFLFVGGTIELGAERMTADFRNHDQRSTFDVTLYSKIQKFSFGYSTGFGNFGIDVGADVLDEFQHALLFGKGSVRMKFPVSFLEGIRIGIREYSFPLLLKATYLDSELPISRALRQTAVEASLGLSLLRDDHLSLEYVSSGNSRRNDNNPFTLHDETESRRWTASVRHEFLYWTCEMMYDNRTFRSSDGFLHDDLSFGEASLSDARDETILVNCKRTVGGVTDVMIDAGFENIEGSFVGNLQSWPFMSVLQSVITNRINFRFTGSLRYWQIGFGKRWNLGMLYVQPSVAYYDVRPDIVIQSWQPQFLVVGVSQFSDNSFDVIHAGLGRLEVTIGIHSTWVDADFDGTQFVPIFQDHRSVQGGPAVPPSPTPEQSRAISDGGRWVRLTLRKHI